MLSISHVFPWIFKIFTCPSTSLPWAPQRLCKVHPDPQKRLPPIWLQSSYSLLYFFVLLYSLLWNEWDPSLPSKSTHGSPKLQNDDIWRWGTWEVIRDQAQAQVLMLSRDPMLFVTPWIVVHQAPLSVGLSRQEYWSGFSPGDLPDPGIELTPPPSPSLQADFFFF